MFLIDLHQDRNTGCASDPGWTRSLRVHVEVTKSKVGIGVLEVSSKFLVTFGTSSLPCEMKEA